MVDSSSKKIGQIASTEKSLFRSVKTVVAVAFSLSLAGCANLPNPYVKESSQSRAAQRVEADSSFLDNSYWQACGAGIAAAVLVAWATADGDDHSLARYLTAGGVGCGLALGANFMLQKVREGYKVKQEDKIAALNTIRQENSRLSQLINSTQALVSEDKQLIRQTEAELASRQISISEAQQRMRAVNLHTADLRSTLGKLEQRKAEWTELQSTMQSSQTASEQQAMQVEITGLEQKVSALKQELLELEKARSVSSIG